jgi:chromosome segregation ATPase
MATLAELEERASKFWLQAQKGWSIRTIMARFAQQERTELYERISALTAVLQATTQPTAPTKNEEEIKQRLANVWSKMEVPSCYYTNNTERVLLEFVLELLRSELAGARTTHAKELQEAKQETAALLEQLDKLHTAIPIAERSATDVIKRLRNEIQAWDARVDGLKQELEEEKLLLQEAKQETAALQVNLAHAESQYRPELSRAQRLQQETAALQDSIARLEKELKDERTQKLFSRRQLVARITAAAENRLEKELEDERTQKLFSRRQLEADVARITAAAEKLRNEDPDRARATADQSSIDFAVATIESAGFWGVQAAKFRTALERETLTSIELRKDAQDAQRRQNNAERINVQVAKERDEARKEATDAASQSKQARKQLGEERMVRGSIEKQLQRAHATIATLLELPLQDEETT